MARPAAILAPPARVVATNGGPVSVIVSTRDDGDFNRDHVPHERIEATRRRLVDLPWTLLDERHGAAALRVDRPGGHDGAVADAAVTSLADAVLGVWVGDCAPVVLVAPSGEFAVVHAGWRGIAAGVVHAAIRCFEDPPAHAVLGPVLRRCCNEFGESDLFAVARSIGAAIDDVRGTTTWATPSLDLPACIAHVLRGAAIEVDDLGQCTGCDASYYSNRMRADTGRHLVAAVRNP